MFRVAETSDDIVRAYCIRAIVFMGEQECPYAEEIDGLDDDAIQVLGEINGEPIATGRIRFIGGHARLERLAVLKSCRGKGYGDGLLKFMMELASANGSSGYRLHAQVYTIPFYERHGFRATGEVFEEAGIPHRLMEFAEET
jgi:predicted GNAT family N-acyltransferase